MTTSYALSVDSSAGMNLSWIDRFISLDYTRTVNGVGALTVTLDGNVDHRLFARDTRLGVWRSLGSGAPYLDTDTLWLVRRIKKKLTSNGARLLEIGAVSANELLKRRIVAYPAGSAYCEKSGAADDVMKAIVRENFGSLINASVRDGDDTGVDLSSYLDVQVDRSEGASIHKGFARREVFTVLKDLADDSTAKGVYLAFDMIWNGTTFEFQTYSGQRGVDRRFPSAPQPVLLGPDFGTLGEVERSYDYADEMTVAVAGGQGEEENRTISTAADAARRDASPFNRREVLVNATNTADILQLSGEAEAAVRAGRPRETLTGRVLQTESVQYGKHWHWGDYVTVAFDGETADSRVDVVRVQVTDQGEHIDARIRADV